MKVKREEVGKVIEKLRELGGIEEKPPKGVRARFRFKEGVVQVYDTGSVTFGGKEAKELVEKFKEVLAEKVAKDRKFPIVGCDEAGKGELFGPLVVACLWADRERYKELVKLGVKDSKKLSKEKIEELANKVKKICHGRVRVLRPEKYNKLYGEFKNQNRLLEEVYLSVLRELVKRYGAKVIVVDKFSRRIEERLKEEFPEVEVIAKEKGEDEPIVAAAAVVAKAVRLKELRELSKELGREIEEGNLKARELLREVPKEKRYRFVKEHFKVEDRVEES